MSVLVGTVSACLSAPEAVAEQALTNGFRTFSAPGVANSVHLTTECTWMAPYVIIICSRDVLPTASASSLPYQSDWIQIGIFGPLPVQNDWDRTLHWHGWSENSSEGSTPSQHSLKQALKWRAEPRDIQFLADWNGQELMERCLSTLLWSYETWAGAWNGCPLIMQTSVTRHVRLQAFCMMLP